MSRNLAAVLIALFASSCPVHCLVYPTHMLTDECKSCDAKAEIEISHYAMLKGLDEIWNDVQGNTSCCLTLKPPPGHHLAMRVNRFHVDFTFSNIEFIDLANNQTVFTERYQYENGTKKPIKDIGSANGYQIKWHVKTKSPSIFMDIMLTSYVNRSDQPDKRCPDLSYISCDSHLGTEFDDRCIEEVLVCDENNNCGNDVDESRCHQMPVTLMFFTLSCITFALFATGYRIAQVIASRFGSEARNEWVKQSNEESGTRPASEDEDPLLGQDEPHTE